MIAWNSQMALDAGQHLFFMDTKPERVWKVRNDEGKEFALKLYHVDRETDAVREGYYIESKYLGDDSSFDPRAPEGGTEWAYLETTLDNFLAHYETVEEVAISTSDESGT